MNVGILSIIIIVASIVTGFVLIGMLVRYLILQYFRINELLDAQYEQIRLLKKLVGEK